MTGPQRSPTLVLALGLLSALGPLAIDMYLPGLPLMVSDLNASEGTIQFSLVTFFAGLTLGQLAYGPLSDRLGRKPLIYVGLMLFTLGSIGCALSASVPTLLIFRGVQGLGGSIGMVIATAIVRDLYTGQAAARLMALVMMVLGVSPVLAPLAGSATLAVAGWQGVFWLLAAVGVALATLVALTLPETRSHALRATSHPAKALGRYAELFKSPQFMPFVMVSAIAQAGFFAYISGSAFVFMSIHGLSPVGYSLLFAVNAVGLVAANQFSPRVMRRFGAEAAARGAVLIYAVCGLVLLSMELAGVASLVSHSLLLFGVLACVGMLMPVLSVRAMAAYGAIAGTAAALMGALQFLGAAFASGLLGLLSNGTALPLVSIIAGCGIVAACLAFTAFPHRSSSNP